MKKMSPKAISNVGTISLPDRIKNLIQQAAA
jgi:hypothetical protein